MRPLRLAFVTVLVPDYKVWLYQALDRAPEIEFMAVHGPERRGTAPRDAGRIGLSIELMAHHRYWSIGSVEITWIPAVRWLLQTRPDVLVLQDGVRILSNWLMHIVGRAMRIKVLYYSHGFNHQGPLWRAGWLHKITERLRRFILQNSDGVLVYSTAGKEHLEASPFSPPVTVVGSMIDGRAAIRRAQLVTPERVAETRRRFGVAEGDTLIVSLGRLVEEKRPDVFIDTIAVLSEMRVGRVVGLLVGDGPLRPILEARATATTTLLVGHVTGTELSELLVSADIVFMPGMVGLAIVEAFCTGTPFIAVDRDDHSPEISYLQNGVTGMLVRDGSAAHLAQQLANALRDRDRLAGIGAAAAWYAHEHFCGEAVVCAFVDAVLAAHTSNTRPASH